MNQFTTQQTASYQFEFVIDRDGYRIFNMSHDEYTRQIALLTTSGIKNVSCFLSSFVGWGKENTGVNNYCIMVKF